MVSEQEVEWMDIQSMTSSSNRRNSFGMIEEDKHKVMEYDENKNKIVTSTNTGTNANADVNTFLFKESSATKRTKTTTTTTRASTATSGGNGKEKVGDSTTTTTTAKGKTTKRSSSLKFMSNIFARKNKNKSIKKGRQEETVEEEEDIIDGVEEDSLKINEPEMCSISTSTSSLLYNNIIIASKEQTKEQHKEQQKQEKQEKEEEEQAKQTQKTMKQLQTLDVATVLISSSFFSFLLGFSFAFLLLQKT